MNRAMLNTNEANSTERYTFGDAEDPILFQISRFFLRQKGLIVIVTLIATLLGLTYIVIARREYTANTQLLIDNRQLQPAQTQLAFSEIVVDTAMVESQVQILRSDGILLRVVKDLHLTEDAEFDGSRTTPLDIAKKFVKGMLAQSESLSGPETLVQRVVQNLASDVGVRRVGISYVIEISFTSQDAQKAAAIASAIVNAYFSELLEAKGQLARKTSEWLQDRANELRVQAAEAERRLLSHKVRFNIIEATTLLGTQQLAELNAQVALAQAQTARARTRLEQAESVVQSSDPEAGLPEGPKNDALARLHAQYRDLVRQEVNLAETSNGTELSRLREQIKSLRAAVIAEAARAVDDYRSELDSARAREETLRMSLNGMLQVAAGSNEAQSTLRDLESAAQSSRALYDNFVQKQLHANLQSSFPFSEARVITPALPPQVPSHPKKVVVLGFVLIGGFFLGVGAAIGREQLDRTFRTRKQVQQRLGVDCIGVLPLVAPTRGDLGATDSSLSDALRGLRLTVDTEIGRQGGVLAFSAVIPQEGSTTVAVNFARMLTRTGASVLLVDLDVENASLSRALVPHATAGLRQVLMGEVEVRDVTIMQDNSLFLLPLGNPGNLAEPLNAPEFGGLIDRLRASYPYIVFDLPPISRSPEARAAARFVDGFLLVVEWGVTPIEAVVTALREAPEVDARLLGVFLNKTDVSRLRQYGDHY